MSSDKMAAILSRGRWIKKVNRLWILRQETWLDVIEIYVQNFPFRMLEMVASNTQRKLSD